MVFCQAGFGQRSCTEINYLSIRKAFGEKQGLLEWTKPDWSQLEFILQGFLFCFFNDTQISQIHAAPGCFRNEVTSPEGWPSIDATDSVEHLYSEVNNKTAFTSDECKHLHLSFTQSVF